MKNKRAQEEIVGFAVIIIIVAIVMLFLLGFYIGRDRGEGVESFEVNSFIQSFLHVTTRCEGSLGYYDVRRLISECIDENRCLNEENSCEVLEETLEGIVESSWQVGEDRPIKGYNLIIQANQKEILALSEGNETSNFRGGFQDYVIRGDMIEISFRVYYS